MIALTFKTQYRVAMLITLYSIQGWQENHLAKAHLEKMLVSPPKRPKLLFFLKQIHILS